MFGELLRAIGQGEIELYYQPQIELTTQKIVGLEALVRWHKRECGTIPPKEFIPMAEETGLITSLGKWIFDDACRQSKKWQDLGILPATIAVNISPVQCRRAAIVDEISSSLAKWGIEPENVELELTEMVLLEPRCIKMIEHLRALGVRIAIDDFGTGYSSLAYLAQCEVDRLKIPREFVSKVANDHRHASIVRSIVRLAEELRIDSVAEGVENNGQEEFLKSVGCRRAQGYLYGRPTDAETTTELLSCQLQNYQFESKH